MRTIPYARGTDNYIAAEAHQDVEQIIRESHTSERACPTCGAGLRCHVTNWSDYTCDACGGQFIASRPGFETLNPAIKSRPFPSEC